MPDLADLKDALTRLISGTSGLEDRELVRGALETGALSLSTSDRAAAVGGSADHSLIVTGDGNVVLRLAADEAAALRRIFLPRERQLPADLADFRGRDRQVRELCDLLSRDETGPIVASIGGMPGLGKTALAVHVGHKLGDRFPDGQLFLDLEGLSDTAPSAQQSMARVIRAFEPMAQLPDGLSDLRSFYLGTLRGRRVLILADNARHGDQVSPLCPPEGCGLIVTSRRNIAIPGLKRIDLDLMSSDVATECLRSILSPERADEAQLVRLAELCGHLPLALRVAGTFLDVNPHWRTDDYIEALSNERGRLARLALEGSTELDVAASLGLSLRELRGSRPQAADLWHLLWVFPGDYDLAAAAAVWELELSAARDVMAELLGRNMVLFDTERERYRLHDLMRDLAVGTTAHAQALYLPEDLTQRLTQAAQRHAEHYCTVLAVANDLFLEGNEQFIVGLALFERERQNIEAGQTWAATQTSSNADAATLCLSYSSVGANVLSLQQPPWQRVAWLKAAVDGARQIGDRRGECHVLGNLGAAFAELSETRRAIEFLEQALEISREIGDRKVEGATLGNLGIAYKNLGETRRAIDLLDQALEISREIGDLRGEGATLGNLGIAYKNLGENRRAIEHHQQHLKFARDVGDRQSEGNALGNLSVAYLAQGETCQAIEFSKMALEISREIGDRRGEGADLDNLGLAYKRLGEIHRAIEHHSQALEISQEVGDREGESATLGNIGLAYADLGDISRAIEFYARQLEIARQIGDQLGECNALGNLGNAHATLGDTPTAIEHYKMQLEIAQQTGDRRGEGNALFNLSLVLRDTGDTYQALVAARTALRVFQEIDSPQVDRIAAELERWTTEDRGVT